MTEEFSAEEAETMMLEKDERVLPVVQPSNDEDDQSECESSSRSEADVARSAMEVEADALARFIERQRIQTMFELRCLRMGERPVTGQPNRERIQTFLTNVQEQQREQARRAPASRPAAPSAHTADIDALATRRCVSAALSSASFRQDLENAVRRSVQPPPTRTVQEIPRAPPLPEQLALPINEIPLPPTVEREEVSPTVPEVFEAPWNLQRQERELTSWQTITQLQRDTIILEISDLVHRQLVSSALESDFRQHLEDNILNRLATGAPPPVPQDAMPVVAAPRVPPNPAPVNRNARMPVATVDALSSRLDEMQRMLQMMFSMQTDMQRSIRQEVASALSHNASAVLPAASQSMTAGQCTVCLTATADTVMYRCGHLCVCYTCGLNLQQTASASGVKCPICRAPVDDILRIYRSSRDA